ncbi:MAG: RNA polymerase sigma factor region1.1 domain-containing protein, partial [Mariprofundaceae bacterium]
MSNKQEQVAIRELGTLMAKGKQAGFITYEELNKHLPGGLVSADRVEQLINVFTEMGVEVVDPERAPTGAYAMRKDRL